MRALSASRWGVVGLIALTNAGLAQQPAGSKPEVISITGIGVVLPRQAGTKDAPGISLATPTAFELQSATSQTWISDNTGTANSKASTPRRKGAPRR